MDYARTRQSAHAGKIVWLADYRRRVSLGDNEDPPNSPRPSAARRPAPPTATDAFRPTALTAKQPSKIGLEKPFTRPS
jgi:hypothetical protein